MLIKQILKKIITGIYYYLNQNPTYTQIERVNNFVFSQIRNLPSTHRFAFYSLTIIFIFVLLMTKTQISKLLNFLMKTNFLIVKKYIQSLQGLVYYFISGQDK